MTRRITPKRMTTLLLAGTAAGVAFSGPGQAATGLSWDMPSNLNQGIVHVSGEGGEAGESGAIKNVSPDAAYITRIGLVEGHLIAAQVLYERGMTDEAIGLSGHPEAEMMDEVRDSLAQRGAADFSDALEHVGQVMAEGASPVETRAALEALHQAVTEAEAAGNPPLRARFDAITALTQAAARGFAAATADGTVEDVFGYHESLGFLKVAQDMAAQLATSSDPAVAEAATRTLAALEPTMAEYGDITSATLNLGDPSVIFGAAAKVELAGLRVK